MKIVCVTAGAGGMYCGSCLHDNTLAAALQQLGHEVALLPTYSPIRTDEEDVSTDHVFFGGINVFLQEKFSLFRSTPDFIDNLLNRPTLLNWAMRFSSATRAKDLGKLTVSMLKGEKGHQEKELRKLVAWLRTTYRPEVLQLPNAMFLGFAHDIKRELGIPVLCALQGEDLFLEELIEPYQSQAKQLLKERAGDVDAFIANSDYYADYMSDYLGVERGRIHTIPLGINLNGHGDDDVRFRRDDAFVVGYLARICPEKGFHLLVEAFHRLWKIYGRSKVQLKIAGYLGKKDMRFYKEQQKRIADWGMAGEVEYVGEVDRLGKIVFLNSLDVLCVPTVYHEPKGLFVLEAMANGIPVVQPRHGAFPEIIAATGGGMLVEPASPAGITQALQSLAEDREKAKALGRRGKEAVHSRFSDWQMASATASLYEQYVGTKAAGQ